MGSLGVTPRFHANSSIGLLWDYYGTTMVSELISTEIMFANIFSLFQFYDTLISIEHLVGNDGIHFEF